MKKISSLLFCILISYSALAQDNCSSATALCANNTITSSTAGATVSASDPSILCGDNTVNNSVWFTVFAINNGNATITVTQINNNPGLEMEVYTGSCGSLSHIGACTSGIGPAGSMNVTFATTAGTTYYIMVDGTGGNQEAFNILATTSNDAIIARPDANFNTNPVNGCVPLSVLLQNTTTLHGGTNITYQWRVDGGAYLPASGSDSTIVLNTIGTHTIDLRVCNSECGCKSISQDVVVQDLFPSISYSSFSSCLNSQVDFFGDALVLPDPPHVDANVNNWDWNFGDPGSGVNNTATGQFPSHTFVGPTTSFTVRLIIDGTCGPDTVYTNVSLNPQPVVSAGPDQIICEGNAATLTANVISGALPIQSYNWVGPGTINCTNCVSTTVDNLAAGGPYLFSLDIIDANGCTASTTVNVTVNPKPVVFAGSDQFVCRYTPVTLTATPLSGIPPFTFAWTPAAGLDDSTLQSPTAIVNVTSSFCVTISDSLGCTSDASCVNVIIYPPPTIDPTIPIICATNPVLIDTFTVNGSGPGSTYSWILSPDYSLITGATVDSSSIYVTFPSGVAATYAFTAIVTDGVTGCVDTVSTTFTIISGLSMSISGPLQICAGQSATLTASGAINYTWSAAPAYSFVDSSQASQTVSPLVTTTFSVLGTAGGCSQSINYTLTVNPNPVATAAPIADFCGCATVTLNGTGSTPGMSYLWTSVGGSVIANPNALITTSNICTSETFILTVLDTTTGCFASTSVSVNVLPNPVAVARVVPNLICQGIPTLIALDGTGSDSVGVTYLWTCSDPTVIITSPSSLITNATVSNTATFFLTVTDASGCSATASDVVNIYPPPLFTATPAFLCTSDPSLVSSLDVTGAGGGSTYNWTTIPGCATPNSAVGPSQIFDFSICGVGVYNFNITVTDGVTSCVSNLSQTVTIISGVVLTVSNDTSICEGSSVTLTASGANSFLWSTTNTTSSVTFGSLTAAGSPYQFIVTGTVGSCTGTDTINVIVNPIPVTSSITGSTTVCANDIGSIYSVTPIIGNYTWAVTGGIISSGQGTNSIGVDWGSAGAGTVSVFDTTGAGCHGALQSLNVTINPVPVTSPIVGPDSVCQNSATSYFIFPNAGSTYNWIATGGIISGSSTAPFVSVTWGVAGSGSVTVTETNAVGCVGTPQSISIVINPIPVPVTIFGNANLCQGDTLQLYYTTAALGSTYNWVVSGGSLVSGQGSDSVFVNWGAAAFGSVTALETNSFGCTSDSSTFFVTLNPPPVATIFPDSASVCNNSPYPVSGSVNIGTIRWTTTGSGTFNDTTIASPVYNPGVTDTGYVTLMMVVTSPPCSDDTATIVLFFTSSPIITLTATQSAICQGNNDTLIATGGGTYLWLPNGEVTDTIIVSPLLTTTYTVTVSTGVGCVSVDSMVITVDTLPLTSPIIGIDSVCANDTNVIYTILPHIGNYVWTVTGGVVTAGQGTDSIYVNWGPAGAGTVSMIDTTAAGCSSLPQSVNVVISPLPATSPITGPDTVCENSSMSYFVSSTPGSTYNWSVSGGAINGSSTGSFISVTWGPAGVGFVTVSEINATGCNGTPQSKSIVINAVPLPVLVLGNAILCEGDTIQYYYTLLTAGSIYNWNVTGGVLVSGQGTDSILVNWGTAGIGSIVVLETNLAGCTSDTSIYNVTLNPRPVASALPDSGTVCQNSAFSIFGSANIGTIHWTTSGTGTFSDTTYASPVYSPGSVDTGYVTLTMVLSNAPCPNDTAVVVIYVSLSPTVTIAATQTTICFGDTDTLTATGIGVYRWTPGGDTTSTIYVHPVLTTTYVLTVTNVFGCSTSDSILVTVIPPGIPDAGADQIICIGDSANFIGSFQNAGGLKWSTLGDGIFLPDSISPMVTYVPGVNDSATGGVNIVLVTTGACLNLTDTIHVSVDQFPVVYAGRDTLLTGGPISGATIQLTGVVANVTSVTWRTSGTGTFSPDTTSLNAVYTPSVPDYDLDSVIITLTTLGGCRPAIDHLVITFSPFNIPNVISPYPSSPGFNDFFEIKNLPPGSGLKIWDRWGTLVFVSDYYRNDWDAAESTSDTFYYVLTTDKKEYKGWIQVFRN